MKKIDWSAVSAIVAAIAVIISVIALWFQRRDLKKQSIYQRNTFELQNIINNNNIIYELSGEIVGILQTQVQIMQSVYQEQNILNSLYHDLYSLEKKLTIEELEKDKNITEIRLEIKKAENNRDELILDTKTLTQDLTSKGNIIQYYLFGGIHEKNVNKILEDIKELIAEMYKEVENSRRYQNVLNKKEFNDRVAQFSLKSGPMIKKFQAEIVLLKNNSDRKLEELKY
ncbi:hypothetical protein [Lactococcus lactis]|uniref:hypothetical protein n=1 Tax=Lactococcus lactis TaxID=1358 RepID=UPI0032E4C96C